MSRETTLEKYKWDLSPLYSSNESWEEALKSLSQEAEKGFSLIAPRELSSATALKELLENYFALSHKMELVYCYASLRSDEDISNSTNKQNYDRAVSLLHRFMSAASWIEPCILQIDDHTLETMMAEETLKEYTFYLTKLKNQKAHILSTDKEQILSLASRTQDTPKGAFSALTNVDMTFGEIEVEDGKVIELTKGNYGPLMKSKDRSVRERVFNHLHEKYLSFENTLAELLHGHVKNHVFNAEVRNYKNCLEAALQPNNIPVSVYHNLIESVHKGLPVLHKYVALRKKILGLDDMYYYDLGAPLAEAPQQEYSYEEASEVVLNSVALLGKDYQDVLRKGLLEDRWVDVYENKGKRSGAYSCPCYGANPYILLNFQGKQYDVLTLSHEAGHSMNTYYSIEKQPFHYYDYTIFVAEVASTFNEQLTYDYLFDKCESKQERIKLLSEQLDAIVGTFFRQTLYAEFELKIHEMVENFTPLTADSMKEIWGNLHQQYYGKDLHVTEELKGGFLRIPHFLHYNFYVYQYATGIAAAITLVEKVREGNLTPYMDFLAAGDSDYSIDILKSAGADMTSSEPIEKTLEKFSDLLERLEKEFEKN